MKVEIWSDVTCSYCYIAKRQFEVALSQFKYRDKIEITWRSFELAPGLKTDPSKLLPQFVKELHGISIEQVQGMFDHVTNSAKEVGLEYYLDKTIPANSFNAHRLSHFAKDKGLQEKMKERIFKGYFSDGENIDDIATLTAFAEQIGLNASEVKNTLESARFTDEVNHDLAEARLTGITSVPKYVFNKKSKLSGTQDSNVYLEMLEKEFAQWQANKVADASVVEGKACKIGEQCE